MRVRFRQCTGLALALRVESFAGRYCRECATLTFRRTTKRTLLVGWWGIFAVFANAFIVATNLLEYRRVRGLGKPRR
jgi:hypothetical protein